MVVVLGGMWCWSVMMDDGFGSGTVSFGGRRYWGDKAGGVGGFLSHRPEDGTITNLLERYRIFSSAGDSTV